MKNYKFLYLLIIVLLVSTPFQAKNVKEIFLKMPADLTPLLTDVNKADCIDFLASNMKAQVKNKLEGISEMTKLSADYIHIQMTTKSEWEMKLFPLSNNDYIIGIVTTACGPICNSQIRLFSRDWKELLLADYLIVPDKSDFLSFPDNEIEKMKLDRTIKESMAIPLYRIDLDEETTDILFSCNILGFLDEEAIEKINPYLNNSVKKIWTGDHFE